jgi:hypothetical protein
MNQKKREKYGTDVKGIVRWVVLPASVLLGACSADPVDLGDGRLGVDRSALESYAAVWEGYVEAYEFDSGSDRVRLVLDEQGDGTIDFGVGEGVPVATDPDAAFPFERFFDAAVGIDAVPTPIEGFQYVVSGALVEDERLRAALPSNQIFASACAIQTPVLLNASARTTGPGGTPIGPDHSCMQESGYGEGPVGTCFTGQTGQPVSCSRARLCNSYCECTATECVPSRQDKELRLDAALNEAGDRLEGTLVGLGNPYGSSERATVRLTRVAAP